MFTLILKSLLFITISILGNAQDCFLEIPKDPLDRGLFQPWLLSTNPISDVNCTQTNTDSAVFVEATILDIDTGKFFVYNPLVIDAGTEPAVFPSNGTLPKNNIVIINVGINGNSVTLTSPPGINTIQEGKCINGIPGGSVFGQVAYCNALNFFKIVNNMIADGKINIPKIERTSRGDLCPTVRSFGVVDQDQSDNVITQYIITADGKVAQDTTENRSTIPTIIRLISNGSDNKLLSDFILRGVGCKSFMAPDLVNMYSLKSTQTLNEIQANLLPWDSPETALVPAIDPMVLDNGQQSLLKINLYRQGVNQPYLTELNIQNDIAYCNGLENYGIQFFILHKNTLINVSSPNNDANNLLNYLCLRYISTWNILKCTELTGKATILSVGIDENTEMAISNNLDFLETPNSSNKIHVNFINIIIILIYIIKNV